MEGFLHGMDWAPSLRHDALTPVFVFFTWLGYVPFFLLALPILHWAWDKAAANRLAIVVMASAFVNYLLKDVFQDPRPDSSLHLVKYSPTSYGLPSGHTQIGIVFWLWLAMEIGRRWFWIAGSVFAAGIALSRLYLAVHDVEDILGGAVLGFGGLFLFRWMQTERFDGWRRLSPVLRIAIVAAVLAVTVLAWPVDPVPGKVHLLCGFFTGWLAGVALEMRSIDFRTARPWMTALAVLAGLAAVAGLFMGLDPLFDALKVPTIAARILGGLAVGFFVTFLGPLIFTRLRLMKRGNAATVSSP